MDGNKVESVKCTLSKTDPKMQTCIVEFKPPEVKVGGNRKSRKNRKRYRGGKLKKSKRYRGGGELYRGDCKKIGDHTVQCDVKHDVPNLIDLSTQTNTSGLVETTTTPLGPGPGPGPGPNSNKPPNASNASNALVKTVTTKHRPGPNSNKPPNASKASKASNALVETATTQHRPGPNSNKNNQSGNPPKSPLKLPNASNAPPASAPTPKSADASAEPAVDAVAVAEAEAEAPPASASASASASTSGTNPNTYALTPPASAYGNNPNKLAESSSSRFISTPSKYTIDSYEGDYIIYSQIPQSTARDNTILDIIKKLYNLQNSNNNLQNSNNKSRITELIEKFKKLLTFELPRANASASEKPSNNKKPVNRWATRALGNGMAGTHINTSSVNKRIKDLEKDLEKINEDMTSDKINKIGLAELQKYKESLNEKIERIQELIKHKTNDISIVKIKNIEDKIKKFITDNINPKLLNPILNPKLLQGGRRRTHKRTHKRHRRRISRKRSLKK
jgi:hypothetical protein